MELYCKNCEKELSLKDKFCKGCGRKVSDTDKFCYKCGKGYSKNHKFCEECGINLVSKKEVGEKIKEDRKKEEIERNKRNKIYKKVLIVAIIAIILVVFIVQGIKTQCDIVDRYTYQRIKCENCYNSCYNRGMTLQSSNVVDKVKRNSGEVFVENVGRVLGAIVGAVTGEGGGGGTADKYIEYCDCNCIKNHCYKVFRPFG